ncbi:MAG: 2-hydroxyglutaryl-CoA dehydratase [Deltaproteobacteria bacterium HGW-Deltaproteobacteria-9]|nr:MAG: 2-hydroxyglutaryl-CoA dehydratase [Deltaproteobacteria bacterium HGW-Deltaproteobacteria-9]
MFVAGCDIGSLSAKAVIMKNGDVCASHVIFAKTEPDESAHIVMEEAMKKAGISVKDIKFCVATGYGRNSVTLADATESEITCHGRGAHWSMPNIRMVIDIGGQDAKVIKLDESGKVIRYAYNDRCASGTGRFLEVMANALDIPVEQMGEISLKSKAPITISNQCIVFAETEIISLVNANRPLPDIVSGLHRALTGRVAALAIGIELDKEITMSGGGAKNIGMFKALEETLGVKLRKMEEIDPQINGALGAALIARDLLEKGS